MISDRIQRLLGGPQLTLLRVRLRRRFERASPGGQVASFRIDRLTPVEHAALASLQGMAPRFSSSIQVDVARIDAALSNAGLAHSLREVLERLDGPIEHGPSIRNRKAEIWSETVAVCTHDGLTMVVRTATGLGLLKRLSKGNPRVASELLYRVETVLHRLPANGMTRARLAAEVLGDAHALDNGQAIATLVLAAWRQTCPAVSQADDDLDPSRDNAREVWAKAGVLLNELARPALFLNLPMRGTAAGRYALGEPGYISLRELLRTPPCWDVASRDVFVCENPNLLAIAADCHGARCAPMLCTDGMPSAAQQKLLAQLTLAGANLHFHGDFDWAGLRIGNYVIREYGARPWRFCSTDYQAAVEVAPNLKSRLTGAEVNATWDDTLSLVMRRCGLPIHEEAVAGKMMPDLKD